MNWVDVVAIVVYSVGAFTFGTVLVAYRGSDHDHCDREQGAGGRVGQRREQDHTSTDGAHE